ncbi:MAG: hypothetical protein GTO55_09485 [Armatimonadetes bacterium]|nr:hypothetical protein [Armatimonadota bacterium]NIM24479.1 hypothetical protein [Armatimonadota bacterium]NIM68350.1 hypothetical protein [Armatimonadota bacterium]NIM76754.1 hypothetical protein [Armatimonadota bacterium]NIN06553.1 hypothetical protein [Armatimonadota bacterium]
MRTWKPGESRVAVCLVLTGAALVILCLSAFLCAGQTSSVEGELEAIVKGLQLREQSVDSAQGVFLVKSTLNMDPEVVSRLWANIEKPSPPVAAERFTWGFQGNRFRQERVSLDVHQEELPEISRSLEIGVFDGEKGAIYKPATGYAMEVEPSRLYEVGLNGSFGAWLNLAFKYYNARIPLSRALIEKGAVIVGTSVINGVECYHLTSPPDEWGATYSWWIAPSQGFALLKYESTPDVPSQVRSVYEFKCADYGGIWLPSEATRTTLKRFADGEEFWTRKAEMKVLRLQLNQPIEEDFFSPEFASGTRVLGSVSERVIE